MSDRYTCLEQIGDNGPCPVHGAGYESGAAALFAGCARGERIISFTCQLECHIGSYTIHRGDRLTVRPLEGGLLWAVSGSRWQSEEIAYLNADAVNRLAGCKLIEEG